MRLPNPSAIPLVLFDRLFPALFLILEIGDWLRFWVVVVGLFGRKDVTGVRLPLRGVGDMTRCTVTTEEDVDEREDGFGNGFGFARVDDILFILDSSPSRPCIFIYWIHQRSFMRDRRPVRICSRASAKSHNRSPSGRNSLYPIRQS